MEFVVTPHCTDDGHGEYTLAGRLYDDEGHLIETYIGQAAIDKVLDKMFIDLQD